MKSSRKSTVRPRTGVKRMTVTLQLHPENDADIIEFLREQENKQAAIKDALRACIQGVNTSVNHNHELLELMSDMRRYMDRQFEETKRLIKANPPTTPTTNSNTPEDELSAELKNAMRGAFKPGRKSSL